MWALREQKRSRQITKVLIGTTPSLLPHYKIEETIEKVNPRWKKGNEDGSVDIYMPDREGLFSFDQVSSLVHLVRSICMEYYISHDNVYVVGKNDGFTEIKLRNLLRRG